MNYYFKKCHDAVEYAEKTKTFGIYHSTENNPNTEIHTHNCCELLLCLKGGKNFLINDQIYEVCDGDLFLANQFEAHKITFLEERDVERYVIEIHPDFLFSSSTEETDLSRCFYQRATGFSHRIHLNETEIAQMLTLFSSLRNEYPFGDDVIKQSTAVLLFAFANRLFAEHQSTDEPSGDLMLQKAISYINRHFSEEITLEMIAKNCFISVNQLCRVFKESLGTTVMKYIIGKRISEAKKLLKAGHSVSDTALICGFRDYSNFIRTFTASVGTSPGKYAKQ